MCVYMCVYVCMCAYMCVRTCVYACMCVCTFVHSKAINSPGGPVYPIYTTLLDKREANEQSRVTGCD